MALSRARRSAVLVYVLVTATAALVVAGAGVALAHAAARQQRAAENEVRARYLLDGAYQRAISELRAGTMTVPNVRTYSIDGHTIALTAADHSATLANSVRLTASTSLNGKPFAGERVVGNRVSGPPTPVGQPAFFVNSNWTGPSRWQVNPSGLSTTYTYVNGNVNLTNTLNSFSHDLYATGSISNPPAVTRNRIPNAPPRPFPSINPAQYLASADLVLPGGTTVANSHLTADNMLIYVNGNASTNLNSHTRSFTIYATGTVTINFNLARSGTTPNAKAVIIAPNINILGAPNLRVHLFASQNLHLGTASFVNNNGRVVAQSVTGSSGGMNLTYDSWFEANPSIAAAMRVPGYWP